MASSHSSSITRSRGRGGGSGGPGCKCLISLSLATLPVAGGQGVPGGQHPIPASQAGFEALSTLQRSPRVGEGGPFPGCGCGSSAGGSQSFGLCWGRSILPALPLAARPGTWQSPVCRRLLVLRPKGLAASLLQCHGGLFSAWVAFSCRPAFTNTTLSRRGQILRPLWHVFL